MIIRVASEQNIRYAEDICQLIYESALKRGTGIAKRGPEYIASKLKAEKAVVASDDDRLVGFSYLESWGYDKFVANFGLIVDPEYRNNGLVRKVKHKIFELSRKLYPDVRIFSITTGLAVMKLNSESGFVPAPFSELTDDEEFWRGCEGCRNYDILMRNNRKMCLCTGMIYKPEWDKKKKQEETKKVQQSSLFRSLIHFFAPQRLIKKMVGR